MGLYLRPSAIGDGVARAHLSISKMRFGGGRGLTGYYDISPSAAAYLLPEQAFDIRRGRSHLDFRDVSQEDVEPPFDKNYRVGSS